MNVTIAGTTFDQHEYDERGTCCTRAPDRDRTHDARPKATLATTRPARVGMLVDARYSSSR